MATRRTPTDAVRDEITSPPVVPGSSTVRPMLALTPSFAGGARRSGGPRGRGVPRTSSRWICTPLIDAYDEG